VNHIEVVVSIIIMVIILVAVLMFLAQSNVDVWSTFKGALK